MSRRRRRLPALLGRRVEQPAPGGFERAAFLAHLSTATGPRRGLVALLGLPRRDTGDLLHVGGCLLQVKKVANLPCVSRARSLQAESLLYGAEIRQRTKSFSFQHMLGRAISLYTLCPCSWILCMRRCSPASKALWHFKCTGDSYSSRQIDFF